MSIDLNLVRDHQGLTTYGLSLYGARKYTNTFAVGAEGYIPLEDDDMYAIFLPGIGANYLISSDPNPAIPIVPGGAPLDEIDTAQNIAHISLDSWPASVVSPGGASKRLYILSTQLQTMTILIYK